jgi:hypothetical protein
VHGSAVHASVVQGSPPGRGSPTGYGSPTTVHGVVAAGDAVTPAVVRPASRAPLECGHPRGPTARGREPGGSCRICRNARAGADKVAVGEPFVSPWAPKPASAAEADLRQRISERLQVDLGFTAVRVARPFFQHLEVWPDIVIGELRVAIEYDTTGRDGLEHVGRREDTDRRKDRPWSACSTGCGRCAGT